MTRLNAAVEALAATEASVRLRAALAIGTNQDATLLETLVERCGVEPDFYVRDMLTWALTRLPATEVLNRLRPELLSPRPQARSQALHTLSKIGAPHTWEWITDELLEDPDDEVARSAWRASVEVVPEQEEAALSGILVRNLGRGDRAMQLSLSRALVALGDAPAAHLLSAARDADPEVAAHAHATMALMRDPELGFDAALHEARRFIAIGELP